MNSQNTKHGFGVTRVLRLILHDPVLFASFFLAVASAFIVPPSLEYLHYLDWHVLSLLLSLMLVVAGLKQAGVFYKLVDVLLKKIRNTRALSVTLTMVCFFSSMFITNDVALITFVPLTILLLEQAEKERLLIPLIVLETIAANLGSMLTPMGNPQNLYLYSLAEMSTMQFLRLMCIPALCSLVLLFGSTIFIKAEPLVNCSVASQPKFQWKQCISWLLLFTVCLLTVTHVLHFAVTLGIVLFAVLMIDRGLFRDADYGLLLTFAFFFIFVGNIKSIPAVSEALSMLIGGQEMMAGILLSQVISNVPAAMLLSGFTEQYSQLILGVNLGGLGTLIASMASLISYKAYSGLENASKSCYLAVFTVLNVLFLILLWSLTKLFLPYVL